MKATEERLRSLMIQGLNGDAAGHGRLLSELAVLLRKFYASQLRGDVSEVEDLVQETLIAVHNRRASYDPNRPFLTWAFAMARYKMIDEIRRKRLRKTVPIDDVAGLFAQDDYEAASAAQDVQKLMAGLPEKQRKVIQYVKLDGFSVIEAAERSGLSPSNVKVSIHRGLKRLLARSAEQPQDAN